MLGRILFTAAMLSLVVAISTIGLTAISYSLKEECVVPESIILFSLGVFLLTFCALPLGACYKEWKT